MQSILDLIEKIKNSEKIISELIGEINNLGINDINSIPSSNDLLKIVSILNPTFPAILTQQI